MNPKFLELVDDFHVHQPWYEHRIQTFVLACPETVEEVHQLLDEEFLFAPPLGMFNSYFWKGGDQEHPSISSFVLDKGKLSPEFLAQYDLTEVIQ